MQPVPEFGNVLDMWTVVMGFLIPIIISFFKNVDWSSQVKQLVTLAVIIPFSAGYVLLKEGFGGFSLDLLLYSFVKILFATITFYTFYWKMTGMDDTIAKSVGVGKKAKKK